LFPTQNQAWAKAVHKASIIHGMKWCSQYEINFKLYLKKKPEWKIQLSSHSIKKNTSASLRECLPFR
jgi:hypothetical protein